MIIFLDEKGSVVSKEFENVNQGSNNANKIYVVAPFPENAVVSASFELPNGYVTQNYLMNVILPDVYNTASGRPAKIWELSIQDVPLTEYYGIIKMQIRAVVNQQVIATARIKFKVQEGVDWQLPASPDETTYIQILDAMSRIDEKVVNKVDINYTLGTTEQKIINDYSGLKIVKVVGDETTTFEVKEDGCFINGEKVMVNEDFAGLIAEIEKIKSGETVVGVSATSLDKPTKVSELENDSGFVDNSVDNLLNYYLKNQVFTKQETETVITNKGFITKAVDNLLNYYLKAEVYTKEEVRDLISNINKFKTEIVSELPSENIDPLTMYFIARVDVSGNDYYEEYLYIGNKFELIGTTKLDLSGYVTTEALNTALSNYVQTAALANYYTKSETDALIGNINTALETILGV